MSPKEPHWAEGMLLLPHHLQYSQRYWEQLLGASWDTSGPHAWGFEELVLSDGQIQNGILEISRCRARTRKGTWVVVPGLNKPGNTRVAERDFSPELERSPDGLMLYLAIAPLEEFTPNASYPSVSSDHGTRYLIEPVEIVDENTGQNPQQMEVRELHARILVGEERNLPVYEKYETLPLVRVYRAGEVGGNAAIDVSFVPPMLQIGASERLTSLMKEVVADVAARNRDLAAEVSRKDISFSGASGDQVEQLFRLHVLNESLAVLRQTMGLNELRPYHVYLELCRLGGRLAVFHSQAVNEYPAYNHEDLGTIYESVCSHIRALLKPLDSTTVKKRAFEKREGDLGLQVKLDPDWLRDSSHFYVGVHCKALTPEELDTLLVADWKIAALDEVDEIFDLGLTGLSFERVHGSISWLPVRDEIKYYAISRTPERWPRVKESQQLGIRYSMSARERLESEKVEFFIYVVLEQKGSR